MKMSNVLKLLVAVMLGGSLTASALTINDPGVVGTVQGWDGDNANEEYYRAQKLLDMGANATETWVNPADGDDKARLYATSSTDYAGTLLGFGQDLGAGMSIAAGWEYVMVKYDGKNAGYVLFYLGGAAGEVPAYSASIWLNTEGQGYKISHATGFNPVSVPDGGLTLGLLGMALGVMGFLKRKMS
jgi:hypothetical protein